VRERDFAGIGLQHSSRIFIGWRGHICLIFLARMLTLYRVAQKAGTFFYALSAYALTSSDIDRFSNLFHCLNQKNICNNTITKDPNTPQSPQICRYTTFWKVSVLKPTIGKKTTSTCITFKKLTTGNNVFNCLGYYLK